MMTEGAQKEVRRSWALAAPRGAEALERFYARLFESAPELRPLFDGVDMAMQGRKLAVALSVVVDRIDALETLSPTLAELGRRHAEYGARPEDYDKVGAALIAAFAETLGDAFTDETRAAWMEAYGLVSEQMQRAAH